ncbi:MAG: hypothetical protein EOO28_09240 [Comamonadaceae bacterium]|nr:MAG: hypothetical protein EOO28_09240 [Comamonadaceae bacterium]
MKHQTLPLKRVVTAVAILASLALGGCASDGTFSVASPGPNPGNGGGVGGGNGGGMTPVDPNPVDPVVSTLSPGLRAVGDVATGGGNVVSALGETVQTVGTGIARLSLPMVGADATAGLGSVVKNAGDVVVTTGDHVIGGLGQIGTVGADPVGTTLRVVPAIVQQTGETVSALGVTVSALDNSSLGALKPVVEPVGGLVNNLGTAVTGLGTQINNRLDTTVIQRVTDSTTQLVMPIVDVVASTTQDVGAKTGLGVPVDNLLTRVGGGVDVLGQGISGTGGGAPVIKQTGELVSAVGVTVASLGGLVNAPAADGAPGGLGALLGGLNGGTGTGPLAPVTNLVGGLTGGLTGGTQGGLGGVLAPVTGLVGGLTGGLSGGTPGAGNVLAPVTNLVGGLTGGATGGAGAGGALAPVLAPVTGLVGGLTGGLTSGAGGAAGATGGLLSPVTGLVGGLTATR